MNYEFKPSFDRMFKKLPKARRDNVEKAVNALIDFFATGQKTRGLGLKQLRGKFGEIRADIRDRILFHLESGKVSFLLVGNHDEIHRYLRQL